MTAIAVTYSLDELVERLNALAAAQPTEDGSVLLDAGTFVMAHSAATALLGHVEDVDLAAWGHGGLPRLPGLDYGPAVAFTRPEPAVLDRKGAVKVPARRVTARLTGPTAGVRVYDDPADLHAQGLRLIDAAATFAAIKAANDPQDHHQQEELPIP